MTQAPAASPARLLDVERIRADFPMFERDFGGRHLAYLDSAATALKPRVVAEAVTDYYTRYTANIHRGIYTTGEEATAAYEAARATIARFINAPDSREIVMVRNATEAINLVAYAWGRRHIRQADTIVLTELEHHSNLVPWQLLAQEKDADLEFVAMDEEGRLNQQSFEVLLRTRPKLVAFVQVSNGLGTINPAREMIAAAHAAGALVLVDGAQAVPHGPVDVQELGADFYVFSGHKTLGPTGSGALWARREILEEMPPFMGGGEMIREVHLRRATFNDVPWKFEAGTPDIAAAIGLGAALDYMSGVGMENVRAHERALTEYALDLLPREVPGIRIHGPMSADERAGIVTFNLPGIHPHDVATLLDREAIAIRAGLHCTQPLHERLGESASARASFNVYTGTDHIDRLLAGLQKVQRVFEGSRGASTAAVALDEPEVAAVAAHG
ncbi:MAG: cysteine desulfurase / selenocysteine lyase [Chloroflexota bacterium]|jgi:cysteine desulfurase/selenocysteine lyase|nr:cysteine desulfurase / selenocysteine lyase [Chloroflexota bacterium]